MCDDNFNDHAANLTCQYLGFEYAEDWGSNPQNAEYVSFSFLKQLHVNTVIDDITCRGDERNITQCPARVLNGHDCNRTQNVWLKCHADYSDWELS